MTDPWQLERVLDRAWPAETISTYDNWILRWSESIQNRPRSALAFPPITPSEIGAAAEKIDQFYHDHDAMIRIQIIGDERHHELDAELDQLGYRATLATIVMSATLTDLLTLRKSTEFTVNAEESDRWLRRIATSDDPAYAANVGATTLPRSVPGKYLYAAAGDTLLGYGRGAVVGDWLSLFSLFTSAAQRGRGLGTSMMVQLAEWGAQNGAKFVCLQVEEPNQTAIALYRKLSFTPVYSYWYRCRD